MWREYNPNPDGLRTDDCTVRAVCAVTGLPWRVVHKALCELAGEMSEMPSKNRVWWAFLNGIGFRQIMLPHICPDCYTVAEFAADHPTGSYVLGPFEHAVAVINGDWWDTWDSGKTVPIYYFEYGGDDNGVRSEIVLSAGESGDAVSGTDAVSAAADAATADDDAADDSRGDHPGGQ